MLILTRRAGETIIIGHDIVVTVLSMKGNQVRIGITAPKDVTVHREEIYQRIQQEKNSTTSTVAQPASIASTGDNSGNIGVCTTTTANKITPIIKKKREKKEKREDQEKE